MEVYIKNLQNKNNGNNREIIQYYDLSHNVITDPGIITLSKETIPNMIEHGIEYLNLVGNFFSTKIGECVGDALTANTFASHIKFEDTSGSTVGKYGGCISADEIKYAEELLMINNRAMCDVCGSIVARMILANDNIHKINLINN